MRCLHVLVTCAAVLGATHPAVAAARTERRVTVRIEKSARTMSLEIDGRVVRRFRVGLGGAPAGDKRRQGDQRTPEGRYYVAWKNPASSFHRFFGLSYPMPRHARRALAEGLIDASTAQKIERAAKKKTMPPQHTPLGGLVGVHGGGASSDWTLGCIAVTDEEAEWLYDRVRVGDEIVVVP